jgi:cell wall-associated NlpC family hydrolase
LAVALGAASATAASPALAQDTGGVGSDGSGSTATTGRPGKATLVDGKAIPPSNAPTKVRNAIQFGNQIRKKSYGWGGGHSYPWKLERRYDCSGSVSWALHGGNMISRPKTSGALASWGKSGAGKWITVYANGGHTYMVIAGLRLDTAGGAGPRWHKDMRSSGGFKIRHYGTL